MLNIGDSRKVREREGRCSIAEAQLQRRVGLCVAFLLGRQAPTEERCLSPCSHANLLGMQVMCCCLLQKVLGLFGRLELACWVRCAGLYSPVVRQPSPSRMAGV
jgi:hypothetical protein